MNYFSCANIFDVYLQIAVKHLIAGNILGKLDESVNPCDDMVRFSCGKWLDETEIPGSKSRWGGFDVLNSVIENTLHRKYFLIMLSIQFKSLQTRKSVPYANFKLFTRYHGKQRNGCSSG